MITSARRHYDTRPAEQQVESVIPIDQGLSQPACPSPFPKALALLRNGVLLHQAGRLADADQCYRRVLSRYPANADALHLSGLVAARKGEHARAADLIAQAISLAPLARYCFSLGNSLDGLGRTDEAIAAYRRAIALRPDDAQAHNNLGVLLARIGRLADAERAYRTAIRLSPDFAGAPVNLGKLLRAQNRPAEAAACYERAIALAAPDDLRWRRVSGSLLRQLGQVNRALEVQQAVVAAWADDAKSWHELSLTLAELDRPEAALLAADRAVTLDPANADAHYNRGLILLRRGDYAEGWEAHEARLRLPEARRDARHFSVPAWTGGMAREWTVLLHGEQGFGDIIQFVRYVPSVAALGARVVLEAPAPLVLLLRSMAADATVVERGADLPPFDLSCELMSLPRLFQTRLETIPASIPYLSPAIGALARWRSRIRAGRDLHVGLVWAGNPGQPNDRLRSLPFRCLEPLWQLDGVRWFSLQVGPNAGDVAKGPPGLIDDCSAELTDFGETAAALSALDLLISVDTAAAHATGALGVPVFLLLRFAADRRYLRAVDRTPWYPSMRLFGAAAQGDWDSVIATLVGTLWQPAQSRRDLLAGLDRRTPRVCTDQFEAKRRKKRSGQ